MEIIPPYLRIYQQILKDLENAFPLSLRTIFLLLFAHHTFPLTLLIISVLAQFTMAMSSMVTSITRSIFLPYKSLAKIKSLSL